MATFAELITEYTLRIGITDTELARKIGVRRQTIFRWREGLVQRPRDREVVLDIAKALRLTPEERDTLLLAAGFAPEEIPKVSTTEDFPSDVVTADEVPTPAQPDPGLAQSEPVDSKLGSTSTTIPQDRLDIEARLTLDTAPKSRGESLASPLIHPTRHRLLWLAGVAVLIIVGLLSFSFFGPDDETTSDSANPPAETADASVVRPDDEPTDNGEESSTESSQVSAAPMQSPSVCASKGEDDILVLVARFVPYGTKRFNVAGRILEALEVEAQQEDLAALHIALIEEEITSKSEADQFIDVCPATILIWGEYDDGRVVAQTTSIRDARIQFPTDLPTVFDVNVPAEVRILALEALGLVLRGEERYAEAAAAFERALVPQSTKTINLPTDNQKFNLNFYLGAARYTDAVQTASLEGFERAIDAYDAALDLASTLDLQGQELLYNRGIAYLDLYRGAPNDDPEKVNLDLAIRDLNAALRIKGTRWDEVPAYTMRGIAHMTRKDEGDMEAAIRDYSAAIALNPKPDYYFNRALGHIAADNSASWEVDLDKALELGYSPRAVYTAKCYAHLRQLQAEEAIETCEAAIAQEPKAADTAYVNYAIALAVNGDQEQAIQYLTEHIGWLNENPGYYERLQGKLADEWLEALKAGEDPFTEEALRNLE